MVRNSMEISFDAISENESFARIAVSAFISGLNPTLEELADIKTAVSEAVTNSIVHAYRDIKGKVQLSCGIKGRTIEIVVKDEGSGIEDIKKAMEPFFTTCPREERAGMGFAFMEAFMDNVKVQSQAGVGTTVYMTRRLEEDIDR